MNATTIWTLVLIVIVILGTLYMSHIWKKALADRRAEETKMQMVEYAVRDAQMTDYEAAVYRKANPPLNPVKREQPRDEKGRFMKYPTEDELRHIAPASVYQQSLMDQVIRGEITPETFRELKERSNG